MNKYSVLYIKIAFIALVIVSIHACNKTIDSPELDAYTPLSIDINGGTWKPMLVSTGTDVASAAPTATTSA